jgi:hypothetical protein
VANLNICCKPRNMKSMQVDVGLLIGLLLFMNIHVLINLTLINWRTYVYTSPTRLNYVQCSNLRLVFVNSAKQPVSELHRVDEHESI